MSYDYLKDLFGMQQNEPYLGIVKQNETYLTGKEVEVILKVSRTTLYRLVAGKKLRVKKVGRSNRYALSDIEKMMR